MGFVFTKEVSNEEYINIFGTKAIEKYSSEKILPSLVICQAILECGWGCSELARQHGNYHAMNWYNDSVTKKYRHWTMERAPQERNGVMIYQREEFCEFDSLDEELECLYAWYNRDKPAYKALHGCVDAYECFRLIKEAGYATSSAYTDSLTKIYNQYESIRKYDEKAINGVKDMAQTKANTLVKNNIDFKNTILSLYENRAKWTYMYGSTGLVVNQDAKVKNYFDYFKSIGRISTAFNWTDWSKENDGKQTTDCSNTMNYVLWGKGCNSCYSSAAPKNWTQLNMMQPRLGAVAWKEGHVGYIVDVSSTEVTFVHMPSVGRTFEMFKKKIGQDDYWLGYALCPVLDYIDAPTPTPSPTLPVPKSIDVKINKTFKVGDVLKPEDCTIKITMSDGTIKTNPMYWYCTPLTISKVNQELTFGYMLNGVKVETKKIVAESAKVVPIKIEAVVNKSYEPHELLKAADCLITVYMSDGTKKINPPGWYCTPLNMNGTNTEYIFGYRYNDVVVQVKKKKMISIV